MVQAVRLQATVHWWLQCTGGTAGYSAPFGAAPALCAGQSGADAGGVSGGADVSLDGSSNISLLFWKFFKLISFKGVFVSRWIIWTHLRNLQLI